MRLRAPVLVLLLAATCLGFIVAGTRDGTTVRYDAWGSAGLPIDILVDDRSIAGVGGASAEVQAMMDRWNAVRGAVPVFGRAVASAFSSAGLGAGFGDLSDGVVELVFDPDGTLLEELGLDRLHLGITLTNVSPQDGRILDALVIINTSDAALRDADATAVELFHATVLHELGHVLGLAHSTVGMTTMRTGGLSPVTGAGTATMFPFRLPDDPAEGATLQTDDEIALRQTYSDGEVSDVGSISGSVRAASGAPVNEIVVRVVGEDGEHVATLTDADGSGRGLYHVPGLRPGQYRVLVETANGRGGIDGLVLVGSEESVGGQPFVHASDEYWQPGDGFDPQRDDPQVAVPVRVRAGRDTGSIDFVLDALPLPPNQDRAGELTLEDPRVRFSGSALHRADYWLVWADGGSDVELTVIGEEFLPGVRVLGPGQLDVVAENYPILGHAARIRLGPDAVGLYTVVVLAQESAFLPGGGGRYSIRADGAAGNVPARPAPTDARIEPGDAVPAEISSTGEPVIHTMLQLRAHAPSHEELWIDAVRLMSTGGDGLDEFVTGAFLILDADRDGVSTQSDFLIGEGELENGVLRFETDLEIEAGGSLEMLVVYVVEVPRLDRTSVVGIGLLALAGIALLRRMRSVLPAALVGLLVCLGCGGDSSSSPDPSPFGTAVTFSLRLERGGIDAKTPTRDSLPDLPAAPLESGQLTIVR